MSKEPTADGDLLVRLQQLEAENLRLENELTRQKEETNEVRRFFSDKSDQVKLANFDIIRILSLLIFTIILYVLI
jgi:predicted nuclease with TOPRIM domain